MDFVYLAISVDTDFGINDIVVFDSIEGASAYVAEHNTNNSEGLYWWYERRKINC